jgi:hypothetical protein
VSAYVGNSKNLKDLKALEREGTLSRAFLQDKFRFPPMVGVERT